MFKGEEYYQRTKGNHPLLRGLAESAGVDFATAGNPLRPPTKVGRPPLQGEEKIGIGTLNLEPFIRPFV